MSNAKSYDDLYAELYEAFCNFHGVPNFFRYSDEGKRNSVIDHHLNQMIHEAITAAKELRSVDIYYTPESFPELAEIVRKDDRIKW